MLGMYKVKAIFPEYSSKFWILKEFLPQYNLFPLAQSDWQRHTALWLYYRCQKFVGTVSNTDEWSKGACSHPYHTWTTVFRMESLCLCPNVWWRVMTMCACAGWTDNKCTLPDGGWESKLTFVGLGKTPEQIQTIHAISSVLSPCTNGYS